MYSCRGCWDRLYKGENRKVKDHRKPLEIDYARIIHSPSFRRLQGKTQLFPGTESDFFRNRLTHSLEVSHIAKDIANKLNREDRRPDKFLISPEVCEIAGLLHDLGHPPFGHNGEKALDDCMKPYGGFEGNAQTLRIIMKNEKKIYDVSGRKYGLNLTSRSILSCLKYDKMIPPEREDGGPIVKGYYSDTDIKTAIGRLKKNVFGSYAKIRGVKLKTIECSIMDLADDIAYCSHDLEDAMKAGFVHPLKILSVDNTKLYKKIACRVFDITEEHIEQEHIHSIIAILYSLIEPIAELNIHQYEEVYGQHLDSIKDKVEWLSFHLATSEKTARCAELRTHFISELVHSFVKNIKLKYNFLCPAASTITIDKPTRLKIEVLKAFSRYTLIESSAMKVIEYRGYGIVKEIFKALASEERDGHPVEGYRLLPEDFQEMYESADSDRDKKRVICDFVAGMTDRYAVEYYERLFSEEAQSLFKPL